MKPRETLRVTVDAVPVDTVASIGAIEEEILTALTDSRPWLCTFVNPASTYLARGDPGFPQTLQQFDRILPDGSGMVMAVRLLHQTNVARISFDNTSLAPIVFHIVAEKGLTLAICGSTNEVAEQAAERIVEGFQVRPLAFDGYAGLDATVDRLLLAKPTIVVIGMGAPLQETVLLNLKARGWQGVGFTCGGYIEQLAKRYQYYPPWVDRWNLRFAYRLYQEPGRLWRRYLLQYPQFVARLGQEMVTRKMGR